jgi:hypothetical protein
MRFVFNLLLAPEMGLLSHRKRDYEEIHSYPEGRLAEMCGESEQKNSCVKNKKYAI